MIQKKEKFKCRNCGYCCTQIVIPTKKEINQIQKAGYDPEDFLERDRNKRQRIKMKNYYCYFLGLSKGETFCRIYHIRPKVCRQYPFFKGVTAECMPPKMFDDKMI